MKSNRISRTLAGIVFLVVTATLGVGCDDLGLGDAGYGWEDDLGGYGSGGPIDHEDFLEYIWS